MITSVVLHYKHFSFHFSYRTSFDYSLKILADIAIHSERKFPSARRILWSIKWRFINKLNYLTFDIATIQTSNSIIEEKKWNRATIKWFNRLFAISVCRHFSSVVKVSLLENSFNLTMLFFTSPLKIFFLHALQEAYYRFLFYNLKHFCKSAQTVTNCDKVNIDREK